MIRVIEHKIYEKGVTVNGVIKSIDTDTGIVEHFDYIVGNEDSKVLELIDNYNKNGILEDYIQYIPENLKIQKHLR